MRAGQHVTPEETPLVRWRRGSIWVLQGGHVKGLGVLFAPALIIVGDDVLTDVFFLERQQRRLLLPPEGDKQQHQR